MIDLHCHILHSMDDGPETLRESVEMCRMAVMDGTTIIAATPHFNPGQYSRTGELIGERVAELEAALQKENIALTIVPGSDVAIFPDLLTHPGLKSFLSINNSRYLLLEFPHFYVAVLGRFSPVAARSRHGARHHPSGAELLVRQAP